MRKKQEVTEAPSFQSKLQSIPLTQIELPSSNTRKQMDAAKLKELAASIKQQGVLQPILLRQVSGTNGHAHYQIISGERRYRAAQAAGLTEIPAKTCECLRFTKCLFRNRPFQYSFDLQGSKANEFFDYSLSQKSVHRRLGS